MRLVLTLVARDFDALQEALPPALEAVAGAGRPVIDTQILGEGAADIFTEGGGQAPLRLLTARALERLSVDCLRSAGRGAAQAASGRRHGPHHHRLRMPGRTCRFRGRKRQSP